MGAFCACLTEKGICGLLFSRVGQSHIYTVHINTMYIYGSGQPYCHPILSLLLSYTKTLMSSYTVPTVILYNTLLSSYTVPTVILYCPYTFILYCYSILSLPLSYTVPTIILYCYSLLSLPLSYTQPYRYPIYSPIVILYTMKEERHHL